MNRKLCTMCLIKRINTKDRSRTKITIMLVSRVVKRCQSTFRKQETISRLLTILINLIKIQIKSVMQVIRRTQSHQLQTHRNLNKSHLMYFYTHQVPITQLFNKFHLRSTINTILNAIAISNLFKIVIVINIRYSMS